MDIIDVFMDSHAALRERLVKLEAPFNRAHGVGWDDCVTLDRSGLLRDIDAFFGEFRGHERAEDDFFDEVSGLVALDAQTRAALTESRRSLGSIMKLFGVVAFSSDGEHVHRLRELLTRLHEELESHLAYEEKSLFPLLRARLPGALLRELGREALQGR